MAIWLATPKRCWKSNRSRRAPRHGPYQQRVFHAWREQGVTGSLLHICGDSTNVLDQYARTGADLIEIDNAVDLAIAKEAIADRATLVGNVHTVTELLQGSRDTVRTAARRCIRQAGDRGFILGSGCLVPRHTPIENVRELVRAAHDHPVLEAAD